MSNERRIVVTGAGRGIGLELVRQLRSRGDLVWGTVRGASPPALSAADPTGVLTMDMTDPDSIEAGFGELGNQTDSLDVLINCAGVDARAFGAAADGRGILAVAPQVTMDVFNVNVVGPMLCVRHAVPLLRNGTDSVVINISSQLGSMEVGARGGRDIAYNMSKAAMNMLTVKAAADLADDGIVVMAVHPGWVSTDLGGSQAPVTPEQSAAGIIAVVDGATPAASGSFVHYDGAPHPW